MKTHYSPKTKKIERCSGKCLYGEDTPHFGTKAEGNAWLVAKADVENDSIPATFTKNKTRGVSKPVVESSDSQFVEGTAIKRNEQVVRKLWLPKYRSGVSEHSEALGVTFTNSKGNDKALAAPVQVTGKPNWSDWAPEEFVNKSKFGMSMYMWYEETDDGGEGELYAASESELSGISDEEKNVLRQYTLANQHRNLANYLYSPERKRKPEVVEKYREQIARLDEVIAKASPGVQRIVYRGTSMVDAFGSVQEAQKALVVGGEFQVNSFHSSSRSYDKAVEFAGDHDDENGHVVFAILTPQGVDVTSVSKYANEFEVILPRNSKYVVVQKEECPGEPTLVYMVAVNNKGEILDGTNGDPMLDVP